MRLGLAILGIGIIYLGFYLQREGFQVSPQAPPPNSLELTMDNADIITGDIEINNKFNLVKSAKGSADKILVKYISDSDIFLKLDFIYNEVQSYISHSVEFKDLTMNGGNDIKPSLQNLNYIVKDYTNILFKIYITLPTIMLSNSSPGDSSYSAIKDETVLVHAAKMVQSELVLIPSTMTRITNMQTTILSNANGIKASMTDDAIATMKKNMANYDLIVANQIMGLKTYYTHLLAAKLPAKSSNAKSDMVTFLNNTISFLTSIQTLLKDLPNIDKQLISTISTQIMVCNTYLGDIDAKEGFQSIMNPYRHPEGFQSTRNPYSPLTDGLAQGIEFRS